MLTAVLIDDEIHCREDLTSLIDLYCPELSVLATAASVSEGLKAMQMHQPQLLLADVRMQDGTGFDLVAKAHTMNAQVVFTSAHPEYAVTAFRFQALDFLLKPVHPKQLLEVIERTRQALAGATDRSDHDRDKLVLNTADQVYPVQRSSIVRCESEGNYARFHFMQGSPLLIAKTMGAFANELTEPEFVRIHRSHIINLNHLAYLDKRNGMFAVMRDGARIPVASRKRKTLLRMVLEG